MARDLNQEDRVNLSRLMIQVFDDWDINNEVQLALLGMPEGSSSKELRRLQGGKPFPEDQEMLDRAEHLLAIADCLRTAYPRSGNMAAYWLHQNNRHFGRRPPLAVMLEGMDGLRQVRGHLDCTQNWID